MRKINKNRKKWRWRNLHFFLKHHALPSNLTQKNITSLHWTAPSTHNLQQCNVKFLQLNLGGFVPSQITTHPRVVASSRVVALQVQGTRTQHTTHRGHPAVESSVLCQWAWAWKNDGWKWRGRKKRKKEKQSSVFRFARTPKSTAIKCA